MRALRIAAVVIVLAVITFVAGAYLFDAITYPDISADFARQRQSVRERIVAIYATRDHQHLQGALPPQLDADALTISQEDHRLEPHCRGYRLTYRFQDGRLWYWDVWTDRRGYADLDLGSPIVLQAEASIEDLQPMNMENCPDV